jgi:Tfp pilus assembly protein PilF
MQLYKIMVTKRQVYNLLKTFLLLLVQVITIPGCGPKQNKKLAKNYYKISVLDLQEKNPTEMDYKKSLKNINLALRHEVDPCYLAHKATLLMLIDKKDESKKLFWRALDVAKNDSIKTEILNNYACLLCKYGERAKATEIFKNLESNKDYLTPEVALVNQAKILLDDGQIKKARNKLAQAVDKSPLYVDAYYYLALTSHILKEFRASKLFAEKTLELECGHQGAVNILKDLEKKHRS